MLKERRKHGNSMYLLYIYIYIYVYIYNILGYICSIKFLEAGGKYKVYVIDSLECLNIQ